jgi:hypothetical protein
MSFVGFGNFFFCTAIGLPKSVFSSTADIHRVQNDMQGHSCFSCARDWEPFSPKGTLHKAVGIFVPLGMRKIMGFVCLLFLAATYSCKNSSEQVAIEKDSTETRTRSAMNGSANGEDKDAVQDGRGKDTIDLVFPVGKRQVVLLAQLNGTGHQVVVRIPVHAQKLSAAVHSENDSLTNIRINQIIYPDGSSDGPLGKTITIATPQTGRYQLVIGHNLMAEGGLVKAFRLEVQEE